MSKWVMTFLFLFLTSTGLGIVIFFSVERGILFGVLFSVLFIIALIIFCVVLFNKKKFDKNIPKLGVGESIIDQAPASYENGGIMVGGYFFLTNKRIFFRAHKLLQSQMEIEIPIEQMKKAKTNGKINQIEIEMNEKPVKVFVVDKKKRWVEQINNCISVN